MTTLTVEFGSEWEKVRRKLADAPRELTGLPLSRFLSRAALFAERTAREGAPRDTSALTRSIVSEVRPPIARVFSTLNYAVPVEVGRRAGARMPPPDALVGWIRRHGLAMSPFVLARSIARRGIKGRFFMRAAKEATEKQLPNFLSSLSRDIGQEWRK